MIGIELMDLLNSVDDEQSFLRFATALREERVAFENSEISMDGFQGPWANNTISHFLDGALAWSEDSGFGAHPGPKSSNPWQLSAQFLWAGRSYE